MDIEEFSYLLPENLIASFPSEKRDNSRLLVFDKEKISDKIFSSIVDYFEKGDVLVLNNTKVIPARLLGTIKGKEAELLFVKYSQGQRDCFEAIGQPARIMKAGTVFVTENGEEITILEVIKDSKFGSIRLCKFDGDVDNLFETSGHIPLPPYIERKDEEEDKKRYQTVYAKEKGSVAAPTAGLHFTEELIDKLKKKGVEIVFVTLHANIGTFRPVKGKNIEEHKMHYEEIDVSQETVAVLNNAKRENKRVIACGTTVVRTLESVYNNNTFSAFRGETNLYIYPPKKIESVDALITNFHLPGSTLLMMIASFLGDIKKENSNWYKIYSHAVNEKYRFFSYGDAMFLIR